MALWPLAIEALRDQQAWHGTLALRAWQDSLRTAHAGWMLQGHYRIGVLGGWLPAGLPAAALLAWRRWQAREERDALAILDHRSRALMLLAGLIAGTGGYLAWPAPLPPSATPLWAATVLLGLAALP